MLAKGSAAGSVADDDWASFEAAVEFGRVDAAGGVRPFEG